MGDHITKRLTETPRGVQSRKHTSSKEGRGEFKDPTVILQTDDAGEAETVESPTNMPVESDRGGINADDLEQERSNQRVDETFGLLGSSGDALGSVMQSTDGEGGGGGGGEGQLLFYDVVSSEGNDEKYTKETGGNGESN